MTDPHRRSRRRIGTAVGVLGLLAALLSAGTATAAPGTDEVSPADISAEDQAAVEAAINAGEIPGVDEIVHSGNITHVANIPKATLQATNSDIAFQGNYAFAGNYDGFVVYDISKPERPSIVTEVLCPARRTTSRCTGICSFSPSTPRAATTRATAPPCRPPRRKPGRGCGSSTSAI